LNVLVTDKQAVDWPAILLTLQRWIRFPYHKAHREWAYERIAPRVLIEELLQIAGNCRTTTSCMSFAARSASSRCITTASARSASTSSTSATGW